MSAVASQRNSHNGERVDFASDSAEFTGSHPATGVRFPIGCEPSVSDMNERDIVGLGAVIAGLSERGVSTCFFPRQMPTIRFRTCLRKGRLRRRRQVTAGPLQTVRFADSRPERAGSGLTGRRLRTTLSIRDYERGVRGKGHND